MISTKYRLNGSSELLRWFHAGVVCVNPDLHVKRVLGVLACQPVGHDVEVPRLAGRVRGEGGGRVADGALEVQRAGGEGWAGVSS